MQDDDPQSPVLPDAAPIAAQSDEDELPVVARMVIEIRSDGRRTIARGALEDRLNDQKVAVRFDAGSPLALARDLTRALLRMPAFARTALRRLRGTEDDPA
jgi:hypothetical protein